MVLGHFGRGQHSSFALVLTENHCLDHAGCQGCCCCHSNCIQDTVVFGYSESLGHFKDMDC